MRILLIKAVLTVWLSVCGYCVSAAILEMEIPNVADSVARADTFAYADSVLSAGYKSFDVVFYNDTLPLYGTVTVPDDEFFVGKKKDKKIPGVVLISGSGTHNRDEEVFGIHRPFADMAAYLSSNGVAVLRFDDRGWKRRLAVEPTSYDKMMDAQAALDYLSRMEMVDSKRVGFIGHSEGGGIVFRLAGGAGVLNGARGAAKCAFAISIAGPAVSMDSILVMQNRDILIGGGMPEEKVEAYCSMLRYVFGVKKAALKVGREITEEEKGVARDTLTAIGKRYGIEGMAFNAMLLLGMNSRWMNSALVENPAEDIAAMRIPILGIYGDKDVQVRAPENMQSLRENLGRRVLRRSRIVSFDVNHLMLPCSTGSVAEYKDLPAGTSVQVLEEILRWILR